MNRALTIALLSSLASAPGCYDAAPLDHQLLCDAQSHRCPAGHHCAADSTCYQSGSDPPRFDLAATSAPADLAISVDLAAASDLGAPDAQPDLSVERDR